MRSLFASKFACVLLFFSVSASVFALDPAQVPVQQFIDKMTREHDYDRTQLNKIFARVQYQPEILELLDRPAERLDWYQYRPIFLKEGRIKQGVSFWEANAADLARAEQQFGVAQRIIVAIIGVETYYGRHRGKHSVVDALSTIGFSEHKRRGFFLSELEHVLLLAREERTDPLLLKGSYAGAMGIPQFIASSFRSYAIDFDDDGKRDLWNNTTDAIGSVANYLKVHKWQRGAPIANPVNGRGKLIEEYAQKGLKPTIAVSELRQAGIVSAKGSGTPLSDDALASIVALQEQDETIYFETYQNFYAITRYNRSPLYAMAVTQLGDAIAARRHQ